MITALLIGALLSLYEQHWRIRLRRLAWRFNAEESRRLDAATESWPFYYGAIVFVLFVFWPEGYIRWLQHELSTHSPPESGSSGVGR